MNPCPAFVEALTQERAAARDQLRLSPSTEHRADAIGRLADLDDLEARALSTTEDPRR